MKMPTFGSGPSGSKNGRNYSLLFTRFSSIDDNYLSRETRTGYFTRGQLAAHFRDRAADRDLQRRDVERGHVVLSAALVVVVDDILSHIIVRTGILYVRLPPSVVNHEHQHENCNIDQMSIAIQRILAVIDTSLLIIEESARYKI